MAAERAILNREGINVIRDVALSYKDEIRHITTSAIVDSVQENYTSECDCVLISCTALYTIEAVAALSILLPPDCLVTSSNLAIAARLNNASMFKQSKKGQK
jgi:maleate cis-trans isomerase